MSKRISINSVAIAIGALVIGFGGGQLLPTVISVPGITTAKDTPDFRKLDGTYTLLKNKFDGSVDPEKALNGARAGLVSSTGDPYTVYMDKQASKELEDQLSGSLSGIGAQVGIKNNRLVVMAPIPGSPAEKAGVRPGDQIARIDQTDPSNLTLDEAVGKIRGKAGTTVKLTLVRGNNTPLELTITRANITVPSVSWNMKPNDIGYIQITTFGDDTSAKIQQAASELKQQGAKRIVLDVRNNGGGYLNAAVAVTSQFLPEDKVVVDERRGGKTEQKLYTTAGGELVGLPLAVLINGGSASASEIVAGSLKDNGAATLIGEKSFGKGSVQDITKLASGGQLKITIAHWFTPNGTTIDKTGIAPDTEVKLTADDFSNNRDPQLDEALKLLSTK